ncbi:MAG TPA: mandelate racemase/muconate lactonizing enzyme family protein [Pseudonocardiaceae bacterium]|nr:mandelate racemase/muconate lactonizing enzyme family protein [Pseudonocardiaceae bacterium]
MKIVSVTARVLRARPEHGVVFAAGNYPEFSAVLVQVDTDEGVTGYGEAIARAGGEVARAAVESLLGPAIVGQDPANIEGLYRSMIALLRRFGHDGGVVVEAISGVDTALWDIAGKVAGKPIRDLLYGAGRRTVPVYASSVYLDDTDVMIAQTRDQIAAGHTTVKLKAGHAADAGGKYADVAKLAAIRDAVGPDVALGVDANSAYDAADAVWVARRLEDLDMCFFEEPVHPDDVDGYARVRARTAIPLAGGETFFLLYKFDEFLRRGLLDVVQPDLGRCGGITGARQVATLTQARRMRFAPHTGFSGGVSHLAALQTAAAAAELWLLEYMFIDNPLRDIFVGGYPKPHDGVIDVPDGPGLGLELDFDLVDKFTV